MILFYVKTMREREKERGGKSADLNESSEITASNSRWIAMMKCKMPTDLKRARSLLLGRYNSEWDVG